MAENSAFISYRRETGYPWARLIWDELLERSINAFLDLESMNEAGRFDHRILNQIAARPYFLIVLAEGSLDRCASDADWVRREVEHAIDTGRIIVPLYIAPFEPSHFPVDIPPRIAEALANSNGVTFYSQFVQAALDQLTGLLRPVALRQVALTDDDAQFEALAQRRVQSEPPPTVPTTTTIAFEPPLANWGDSIDDEPETSTPGVLAEEVPPIVEQQQVDSSQASGPPNTGPPLSKEPEYPVESIEHPQTAMADGSSLAVKKDRQRKQKMIAFAAAAVTALLIAGIVGLTLLGGDTAETTSNETSDPQGESAEETTVSPGTTTPSVTRLTTEDGNASVHAGQPVVSENGRHELLMTVAGQLVLNTDGTEVWRAPYEKPAVPGAVAILQKDDGNFVVYPSETATSADDRLWTINKQPGKRVSLQVLEENQQGFVVVLDQFGSEVWRRPERSTIPETGSDDEGPQESVSTSPETGESGPSTVPIPAEVSVATQTVDASKPIVTFEFKNSGGASGSVNEIQMEVISAFASRARSDQGEPLSSFDLGGRFAKGGRCTFDATDLGWSEIPPTDDGVERLLTFGGVSFDELSPDSEFFVWTMELRFTLTVEGEPNTIDTNIVTVTVPHDPTGASDGRVVPDCT